MSSQHLALLTSDNIKTPPCVVDLQNLSLCKYTLMKCTQGKLSNDNIIQGIISK
jgi:hypothetical protein